MMKTITTSTKALELESSRVADMVSHRSLGSLASVQDVLKSGKQKLTSFVVFACITGAIAGLLFGFDQNVFNMIVAQDDFRDFLGFPLAVEGCGPDAPQDPPHVANQISAILSFYSLGAGVVAPFAGSLSDRFGRYKTLWAGMLVFFLGSSLQTGANGIGMLIAGRLIAGASIGVLSAVVPVYVSELAPVHLRGGLGSFFQVGITAGALLASLWNMLISSTVTNGQAWRIQAGFQIVLGGIMALALIFVPETPRWLTKANQLDKARATLKKLRGDACEAITEAEMKEIEAEVEAEKNNTSTVKDLFTREVRFATMVALAIPIMQQFTGINVFMSFSTTIFDRLCLNGAAFTITQSVVNFVATFGAIYFSDHVGRKKMLLIVSGMIAVLLAATAGIMWGVDMEQHVSGAYVIAVLVCLYTICFAVAWGPNGWIIPSEVFPLRLRGKGAGFATFNNWIFAFIVMYTSPVAVNSVLGAPGNIIIYAALMLVSMPLLYFFMPETKNVPLEEMEAKFNKPMKQYIRDNAVDLRQRKNTSTKDTPLDAKV